MESFEFWFTTFVDLEKLSRIAHTKSADNFQKDFESFKVTARHLSCCLLMTGSESSNQLLQTLTPN